MTAIFYILILIVITNALCAHSVMSNFLQLCGLWPILCPWDSPGKNTGAGCRFLFQEIFPTQG